MLLDDDVVADREAESGTLARGLGGEKRIEHLFPHLGRNTTAVVANLDFDAVTEIFRRSRERGLVAIGPILCFALCRSIEAVGNEVEEYPRDLLWKEVSLPRRRVERALQRDVESLFLGTSAVIGQVGLSSTRPLISTGWCSPEPWRE